MPLDVIHIDSLSEAHVQRLVQDKEQESKTIEFKLELPGSADADKKEFLADFTSFANTMGGDLIYGVRAPSGVAEEVVGLNGDLDAETNRLENILRTGVQPRVTGYAVKPIPLANGKKALVFRVPRSWALPHRVTVQGHDKFYGRHSSGKYALDVPELRSLFLLSESTADRIRNFRAERVSLILSGQTPVPLGAGPKMVLHVVPFNAFSGGPTFSVSKIYDQNFTPLRPPGDYGGWNKRHNFDGIVTYGYMGHAIPAPSYLQLFRTGSAESVDTKLIQRVEATMPGVGQGQVTIWGDSFEKQVLGDLRQYLDVQASLGVTPPIVIMLSLLNIKGACMYRSIPFDVPKVDRDHLLVPEVIAETYTVDVGQLLKPVFDVIWNACGYSESPSYGSDGKRKPGQ